MKPGVILGHCTLAVTDALALSVNVQLRRLLPLLEHAPDQIASRPLLTVSVIDVPALNVADPVVPTLTLMPAGVDVIRSPLRPVAVTLSVAVPPGGGVPPDDCVVKLRVDDHAPAVPAAFRARTRHHTVCPLVSVGKVACDVVTVGFATNGDEMVDVSSTWTS
jgi:hypothetical protein